MTKGMFKMVMVQHRINISRMRYRLEFGHEGKTGKVNTNTGDQVKEFIPEFTRWAGPYSIYGYDALKKSGSDVKDVNAYFIRHDSDITSDYLVRLNGKIYQIDHIQYDEDTTRSQYDVLYCHRWGNKKHG